MDSRSGAARPPVGLRSSTTGLGRHRHVWLGVLACIMTAAEPHRANQMPLPTEDEDASARAPIHGSVQAIRCVAMRWRSGACPRLGSGCRTWTELDAGPDARKIKGRKRGLPVVMKSLTQGPRAVPASVQGHNAAAVLEPGGAGSPLRQVRADLGFGGKGPATLMTRPGISVARWSR